MFLTHQQVNQVCLIMEIKTSRVRRSLAASSLSAQTFSFSHAGFGLWPVFVSVIKTEGWCPSETSAALYSVQRG